MKEFVLANNCKLEKLLEIRWDGHNDVSGKFGTCQTFERK